MAKTGSYIKLDRGLKNNSLWLEKPFSKGQAWVDLLLLAQGIEMDKHYRGKIQHMEPGTVYTSILYLASRWGWGRAKVYRFMNALIKAEMIVIQGWTQNDTINRTQNDTKNGTTNGTIITIENWAFYQYSSTNNDTNNDTLDDTTNRTQNDTHNRKHIRESNKEKAKEIPPKSPTGGLPIPGKQMKPRDEGTVADIPVRYRKDYKTYAEYWDARNQ